MTNNKFQRLDVEDRPAMEPCELCISRDSGFEMKTYRYYDAETCGFDFNGCLEDLNVCSW